HRISGTQVVCRHELDGALAAAGHEPAVTRRGVDNLRLVAGPEGDAAQLLHPVRLDLGLDPRPIVVADPDRLADQTSDAEATPAGDPRALMAHAIEQMLSCWHSGRPKVPSGRKNPKILDELNEALTLPADVLVVRDETQVPVHYTPNSFRPSLFSTVRLGTRVRALVDELPRRTPGNAIRFYQG